MLHRYITINSIDRVDGTPSNFSINIRTGLIYNSCRLIFAQIPNTYYNVTSSNNRIIINGVTRTMNPGNYNLDEFFNEFSNNIDVAITAITYNDTTGIVNFTLSSSLSVSFPSTGSMHNLLGFQQNYNQTSNSHNSSFPPSIAKHVLYIDVTEFSSNHSSSYEQSGLNCFAIPNNVQKNDIIMYNEKTNFKQIINCKHVDETIYNLSFKVKDQYNQLVQGLGEWTMIISTY